MEVTRAAESLARPGTTGDVLARVVDEDDGEIELALEITQVREWQGLSPEEICREHPGLTLAQVHAALAYYYDHRDEIQAEIQADDAFVADLKRPRGPASNEASSARK